MSDALGASQSVRRLRVLDFDLECRPGFWYAGDFVSKIPAAAAWKWIGERGAVQSVVVEGPSKDEAGRVVGAILSAVLEADMVTGHYVRGFDMPLLNAAAMRFGFDPLPNVLVQDTKTDLMKAHGVSKSLENLVALFELRHPKVHQNLQAWEDGLAFFEEDGLEAVRRRVVGDVRSHVELRARMLGAGLMGPPKVWQSEAGGGWRYVP